MSYARFSSESSVSVRRAISPKDRLPVWFCKTCLLWPNHEDFKSRSLKNLWDHLMEHRRAGHKVPADTFTEISEEMQRALKPAPKRRQPAKRARR